MKRSELLKIVREEIQSVVKEYGMESLDFTPGGFEQMGQRPEPARIQRFSTYETWEVAAKQHGAIVQDRGEDWIAVMPNQDKLGTFSKINRIGTLSL